VQAPLAGPDGRLEGRYHHSKETGAPLALILARQDLSRVQFAATLGVSRQAVHRAFRLLRERGIHDEPSKRPNKDEPIPFVPSPALARAIPIAKLAEVRALLHELPGEPIQVTIGEIEDFRVRAYETASGVMLDITEPFKAGTPITFSIGRVHAKALYEKPVVTELPSKPENF